LRPTHASRLHGTPNYLTCKDFRVNTTLSLPGWVIRLKTLAFRANRLAKESRGDVRAAYYRQKDSAMNALLNAGFAWVFDEVDERPDDRVLGVRSRAEGNCISRCPVWI
jgi:hypothetical protein